MSILQANGAGLGGAGDPGGALAGGGILGSHAINQSLRFDGSAAYLSKNDFGTSTDVNKRTFSTWIKQSQVTFTTYDSIICAAASGIEGIIFEDTEKIGLIENASTYFSDALFRDPAAWYHIFFTFDHSAGEYKLYINGSLEKGISGATASTMDKLMNTGHLTTIMKRSNGSQYISGYLAETVALDGYIGDINDFGELVSGVWVPKEIDTSSITFGNNGFYLPFAQDVSGGNSINFGTGRTAKVTYSDASSYDIGASDDFTIEYFLKTQDVGANYGNFMGDYATGGPHHLISYDFRSSTRNINFYTGNGTTLTWAVAGDVTLSNGTWHHFVFQRDGTTLRAYIDGTRLTSVSGTSYTKSDGKVTNFNKDYNLSQIIIGDPHAQGMSGSLSNVRYVIGDTVYADDDSDITVPTATLTAVTGTKLLTAVNATLGDDISTENNDGSVSGATLSYDSPFTTSNFFDDASGNGNHFTANNLAVSDVVPDSPTNNWCTFNPLDQNDVSGLTYPTTYSEGNLKLAQGTGFINRKATFGMTGGKWYWEIKINDSSPDSFFGVSKSTGDARGALDNDEATIRLTNGNLYTNGAESSYGTAFSNGDVCILAVDMDAGKFWAGRNGTWFASGDPAAGTNEGKSGLASELFPSVSLADAENCDVNFGQNGTFNGTKTAGGNSDGNGYGDFLYTVPSGFLALNSANLPEPAIGPNSTTTSDQHFDAVLYTGNGSATKRTDISFAAVQPDFVWLKQRSSTQDHALHDVVRGVNKKLESNNTDAEVSGSGFGTDGFGPAGTDTQLRIFTADAQYNASGATYVAWGWKAGGTAVSNTDGSITTSVSTNADAGISIIKYTGNGTSGATIGHNLGVTPDHIIIKRYSTAEAWVNWHKGFTATQYLRLYLTNAVDTATTLFNSTLPSSSVITLGNGGFVNTNSEDYICYAFAEKEGFSKFGTYVGNANADGTFVYTGFRPAFWLMKSVSDATHWVIYDSARETFNAVQDQLLPNESNAEAASGRPVDFLSNGVKIRFSSYLNDSGQTYIYLAFAEAPFKYANAR